MTSSVVQHLYTELVPLLLNVHHPLDLKEKLSVLTVAAGLRRIAMVNAWSDVPGQHVWQRLIFACRASKLRARILDSPLVRLTGVAIPEEFKLAAIEVRRQGNERQIWIYQTDEDERRIANLFRYEVTIGELLEYPSCCRDEHERIQSEVTRLSHEALFGEYRPKNPAAFRELLLQDAPFNCPQLGEIFNRTGDKIRRYPFIFHTPCDRCLLGENQVSANLNRTYRQLAEEIDPTLAEGIEEIRRSREDQS